MSRDSEISPTSLNEAGADGYACRWDPYHGLRFRRLFYEDCKGLEWQISQQLLRTSEGGSILTFTVYPIFRRITRA